MGKSATHDRCLPTFLVIGAGKAGTTSLYYYLDEHPDVFMAPVKEPRFFMVDDTGCLSLSTATDVRFVASMEEYRALFDGAGHAVARGEASIQYLETDGVAARIHAMVPDVRLVAVLRNPIDRFWSAIANQWRDGRDPGDVLELLDDPERRGPFLRGGFYAANLRPYLQCFGREQLLIELYDDFVIDAVSVVRRIYRHIGVHDGFTPNTSLRANISAGGSARVVNSVLQRVRESRAKPWLDRVTPRRVRRTVVSRLQRLAERGRSHVPALPPEARAQLVEIYRDDVRTLEHMLEVDLSLWLRMDA